jgi:ribosomal protein S18 acetylase RimI-like enzyme
VLEIVSFEPRLAKECASLLEGVPEWFGRPEANASYLRNLSALPSWVALRDGEVIGVITLEQHSPDSCEVHFLAVGREYHRQGIGRALLAHLEADAKRRGARWLLVKTLGPSSPDPYYARTRLFYQAMGFTPLFESEAFWGSGTPALVCLKELQPLQPAQDDRRR